MRGQMTRQAGRSADASALCLDGWAEERTDGLVDGAQSGATGWPMCKVTRVLYLNLKHASQIM